MRGRKIIPVELAEQCRAVGHSYAEMARRFGVTVPAVYFAINPEKRYFPGPRKGKPWSERDDERLVQLRTREGKTDKTIARLLHRTVGSVASRIRKLKAKGVL